ncbi:MAG TPA: DUF6116 family protein [Acidobacteriota bacterium]
MAPAGQTSRIGLVQRFAAGLKFPQVFMLLLAVFLLDLIIPDMIPFVDEILLGLLTVLFGTWRPRPEATVEQEEPRIKNVTPPRR